MLLPCIPQTNPWITQSKVDLSPHGWSQCVVITTCTHRVSNPPSPSNQSSLFHLPLWTNIGWPSPGGRGNHRFFAQFPFPPGILGQHWWVWWVQDLIITERWRCITWALYHRLSSTEWRVQGQEPSAPAYLSVLPVHCPTSHPSLLVTRENIINCFYSSVFPSSK